MTTMLNEAEVTALEQLKDKLDDIRANVRQLINKWRHSLFVHGPGGAGKSFTVREVLDEHRLKEGDGYIYANSRVSPRGLYDRMKANPEALFWIEDTETLFTNKEALGLIRSATGTQDGPRWVTWNVQTKGADDSKFEFRGSLLVLSNANLGNSPELEAIKTRMRNLEFSPSKAEVLAKMKEICLRGRRTDRGELSSDECLEVFEFLQHPQFAELKPNLRDLDHGLTDRLSFKYSDQSRPWQKMLEGHLKGRVIARPKTREQQKADKEAVALEIKALGYHFDKSVELYRQRTGEGKSSYYAAINRALAKKSEGQNPGEPVTG